MWNSSCGRLLLLLIVAVMQSCLLSAVDFSDNQGELVLLPHNPEVEDGNWLTLNCTITSSYTGSYTSRDLYLAHGHGSLRNFTDTNVTLVGNDTALMTRQWKLSDNITGGDHVRCCLPDRLFVISAIQPMTVFRRPLRPSVTGCLILNWKFVNCTWQPSGSQQRNHTNTDSPLNYTVRWKLGDDADDHRQVVDCRGVPDNNSCAWSISRSVDRFASADSSCVRVYANMTLRYLHFEAQSTQFCFRPTQNVVLDGPRTVDVGTDTRWTSIRWPAPSLDTNHVVSMNLVYNVIIISQWREEPVINRSVLNHSLSFTSIPHTSYFVAVRVKDARSRFWSKPASRNFTTASAIPKASPLTSPNAFTVRHVESYMCTVMIYWQTLPEKDHHGQWLEYIVLTRKPPAVHWNERSIIRSPDQPCDEVNINTDADVEFAVIARNNLGDTLPDVIISVPSVRPSAMPASPFAEFVVETASERTVIFSWRLKSSVSAAGLTLFWCQSSFPRGRCADDIHWLDVAASESSYNLTMHTNGMDRYSYGAALKDGDANAENGGIEWIACLYDVSGLAEPVHGVRVLVPSFGRPGDLLVTWVHLPCDVRHGYTRSLVLYYCRRSGADCVDEPGRISLPGHLTGYNLTGLESGTKYGIWLYSWTREGRSRSHSDIVVAMTSSPIMTSAVIAGLVVSSVIVLVLAAFALWLLCKYCRRQAKRFMPPPITVPSPASQTEPNTYASAPMLEYQRISLTRQGSRLSSSSRDSGQFCVSLGSPPVSPELGSESATLPLMPGNHVGRGSPQPAATNYINAEVIAAWCRPTQNNHRHRPSSSATGRAEFVPLTILNPRVPDDPGASNKLPSDDDSAVATADARLTDNHQPNASQYSTIQCPNSDYIPHEWLKM